MFLLVFKDHSCPSRIPGLASSSRPGSEDTHPILLTNHARCSTVALRKNDNVKRIVWYQASTQRLRKFRSRLLKPGFITGSKFPLDPRTSQPGPHRTSTYTKGPISPAPGETKNFHGTSHITQWNPLWPSLRLWAFRGLAQKVTPRHWFPRNRIYCYCKYDALYFFSKLGTQKRIMLWILYHIVHWRSKCDKRSLALSFCLWMSIWLRVRFAAISTVPENRSWDNLVIIVLVLGAIRPHAKHWNSADVIIF